MRSSFNAFGRVVEEYSATHLPVWLGTVTPVPVGGTLASGYVKKGALYPAGTPVNLDGGVLTPFVVMKVTAFDSSSKIATVDVGDYGIVPTTSDYIQNVGATFAKNGSASAITAVAQNADDNSKYDITVSVSLSVGDSIVLSFASTGAAVPNGYLYNDIFVGNVAEDENGGATGAVVKFHAEGILIDRTPAALAKAAMLAAVPGVLQVEDKD